MAFLIAVIFIQNGHAQKNIGGGISYGTEIESVGITVNGQFFLKSHTNIAIAPSFTYYFPKDFGGLGGNYKFKWYEINADANYYFTTEGTKFYALGGLNIAMVSVPTFDLGVIFGGGSGVSSKTQSKIGINLGAGADFEMGNLAPFAQIKYSLSSFDQLALTVGVRFKI